MRDVNLKQVYINNLINIFLSLIFLGGYLILMIFFAGHIAWIIIASCIFALGLATQIYPVYISCKIPFDLKRKETATVYVGVDEIMPSFGWSFSGLTVRRKYIVNLFTSDFWYMFNLKTKDEGKLQFYILASELEKTNFYEYFKITPSFKSIVVNKISPGAVMANIEYFKNSKIIKNINFYT